MNSQEARDDGLTAALRDALPEPPLSAVDWASLQRGIAARAEPLLVDRRRVVRSNVWATLSGWSRRGIPLAAAAAAAALLALTTVVERNVRPGSSLAATQTVEEELAAGLLGGSGALLVSGGSEDEWVDALLFDEEGVRP